MDTDILQRIGLTPGEAKVYVALLGLGQTTTGPLVKKAGVTTSKSYKILARLEEKGLASHVFKNKIKHFSAASPQVVLDLINKQYKELEQKKKQVEHIIPQLIAYQKQIQQEHEAEIYHGLAGLQTVFEQQVKDLNKGEENYVIGITHFEDYTPAVANFFKHLQEKRDKKGIISNFLLGENARGSFSYMNKSKYCKMRYLPYASLVAINIHKNITTIGVFIGTPILFKIQSEVIAENFKQYFKLLWQQAIE